MQINTFILDAISLDELLLWIKVSAKCINVKLFNILPRTLLQAWKLCFDYIFTVTSCFVFALNILNIFG